ncbi:MAG: S-layer homology domain-containing protein [Clostridiaceae bacterium]|nr:S-layer homology domain-containing protein [Clostridiaceae bacterium]
MKKYSKAFIAFLIIISMLVGYVSAAAEFTDVKEADWFAEAVGKLNGLKIIDGMPDGSFSPQGEVTRAQFVKMLVEAMSYKHIDNVSFVDMRPNPQVKPHWASVYVETALRNDAIVKEEEGDRFYPDIPLTRDDMVMMICRALKLEPSDGSNPYFDMDEPNGYFTKVYEEYLVRGIPMNGKIIFNSTGVTTRAQASVIISRLVDYRNDPKGFVKRMAMEERFASGTETPEDITLKREMEIKKALSDPDYIMEPQLSVCNKAEDFEGMATERVPAEELFDNYAGYIRFDNYLDYEKYSPDIQFRLVNIDKGKEILNTETVITIPFISYDHQYERRTDEWKLLKDSLTKNNNLGGYIMRFIIRDEEKSVNGKFVWADDYVKKGETLNYKLYLKRGTDTKEYDIKFKVN